MASKWRFQAVITIPGNAKARIDRDINARLNVMQKIEFTSRISSNPRGQPTHWIAAPKLTLEQLPILQEIAATTPQADIEVYATQPHPLNPDLAEYFAANGNVEVRIERTGGREFMRRKRWHVRHT